MAQDKALGRRLARAREVRHMSQRELSEAAGLTEQALSRIETGVREPRLATLKSLAAALRVSVDDLVEGGPRRAVPRAYRPEVERIADLLSEASHETVRLARRLVEVLVEERGDRAHRRKSR